MKIVFIANSEHVGGGNRSLLKMVKLLKKSGDEPIVFTPAHGKLSEFLVENNIKYEILSHHVSNRPYLVNFIWKIIQYIVKICKYSPDVIHANDLFCYRAVSFSAKILKKPTVCHIRFSVEKESISYYMKILPSVIVFNSFFMKELFLRKNPDFPSYVKTEVIYNFFDPDDYYMPQLRNMVRQKWKWDNKFLVGIVGNLSEQKGHDTFLFMARELLNISMDYRFVIVGKDLNVEKKNEHSLCKLIDELGIQDFVKFLGFQDNIGKILAGLDVLIVPSTYEPFGRVAVEGLLAGLPVVASNVGGLKEILSEAPYSFLAASNDYKSFAKGVDQIRCDDKNYPIISNRVYAIDKFGYKENFKKLKNIYINLSHYKKSLSNNLEKNENFNEMIH